MSGEITLQYGEIQILIPAEPELLRVLLQEMSHLIAGGNVQTSTTASRQTEENVGTVHCAPGEQNSGDGPNATTPQEPAAAHVNMPQAIPFNVSVTGPQTAAVTTNGNTTIPVRVDHRGVINGNEDDECESCLDACFDDDTCSVSSHKRAYTVQDEAAYICKRCDGISIRHESAVSHHRNRSRENECPRSHWPARYDDGFEEYTRRRRILNIETAELGRTDQEHKRHRNQLMHRYVLRPRKCSRQRPSSSD